MIMETFEAMKDIKVYQKKKLSLSPLIQKLMISKKICSFLKCLINYQEYFLKY